MVIGVALVLAAPAFPSNGRYGRGRAGEILWSAQVSPSYFLINCGVFYNVATYVTGPVANESERSQSYPGFQGWHCSGPLG
jgi:hypothetical protein